MAKTLLAALFLILLTSACAPTAPVVRPAPVDPEQQRIESLIEAGQLEEAALAWLQLAAEQPAQANRFRLRAAEAWLQASRASEAAEILDGMEPDDLTAEQRVQFNLALAELALLTGDLATAGWILAQVAEDLPASLMLRHAMLEEMLQRQLENPARESFAALEQALADGSFEPELALALLIEHPLTELESLFSNHRHRPELEPWLDLAVTSRRFLLDESRLEEALFQWQERHPAVGYGADQTLLWLALWRQTRPSARKIAIVLPGRSAMARVSAAVRDGLMSAWLNQPPNRRPELKFIYIDDAPDAIVSAWFEAREAGADFLLGPLEREQVDALLALPDPGLPVLMLNHPTDPAGLEGFVGTVHAIGLLPEEEAELAAIHSLVEGHQRALILAQESDWGRRVAGAFANTFELGGGQIAGQSAYSTTQVDHSAMLQVLLELDRSEQRIRRLSQVLNQPVEAEPQRRTDIDVVFLASRTEDGRQIRPQLRFFGAGDIPIVATSQIIAGVPQRRRDEDLDGITLPLPPWFLDFTAAGQQRQRAETLYPYLSNPNLSRLHALGFDALQLIPWLDLMRIDPLLYLPGLSGRLRLADGRTLERDLPFVRLIDGLAVPVQ
jgi:uncharacterized protein